MDISYKSGDKKLITATVLIGVSGSGKSTSISDGALGQVCSTDKYVENYAKDRGLNYSDAFDKIQEENLFKDFTRLFYIDIEHCIRDDVDFVVDRTNLTIGSRKALIRTLHEIVEKWQGSKNVNKEIEIKGISFEIPKDVVKKRLEERVKTTGKSIPEEVIDKQFEAFELPTIEEGFDKLERVTV